MGDSQVAAVGRAMGTFEFLPGVVWLKSWWRSAGPSRLSYLPAENFGPQSPLLPPIQHTHDRPQLPLVNRIVALGHRWQIQNRLLNVRRQAEQVHNLRHPRPAHAPQPRQIGVVANLLVSDQLLEPVGQSKQPAAATATRTTTEAMSRSIGATASIPSHNMTVLWLAAVPRGVEAGYRVEKAP